MRRLPMRGASARLTGHQRNGSSVNRYHGRASGVWMRCITTVNRIAATAENTA